MNIYHEIPSQINFTVTATDVNTGEVIHREDTHNRVVLSGRNLIRDALAGDTFNGLTHFGVGSGTAAAVDNDTGLVNQRGRYTMTNTTKPAAATVQFEFFLASNVGNGWTLAEAGLFTAATGGSMFARVTHEPIIKSASIAVTYTWTIQITGVGA